MRRFLMVLIWIIAALSLTGLAFGQEKGKAEKAAEVVKPAESAKSTEAPKTEAAKPGEAKQQVTKKEALSQPVEYQMGGLVTAVDTAAGKITIDQHRVKRERKVVLKVGKELAKELAEIKVGDAVNVWVTGNAITTLTKVS